MVWIYFIVISGIVLGFYGLAGAVFFFCFSFDRKGKLLSAELFGKNSKKDNTTVISEFKIKPMEDRLDFLNYRQILTDSDTELKINLISMLSFNPVRENVKLIKIALFDTNEMVRILAANSLQKMDDYYIGKITELSGKLTKDESYENYFKLAMFYDEYIYSTLLPDDITDFYTEKMFEYFEKAYQLSGKNKDVSEKFIRACIRFNRLAKGKELIFAHLELYPSSIRVKFWYCDFLLKEREFQQIVNILREVKEEEIKKYPKLFNAYKWWIKSNE